MKHCLFLFPIFLLFILFTPEANAQRYGTAAGIRMGSNDYSRTFGLTAQQRVLKHVTLEGIVQSDFSRNTTFHLLVERHRPIISKRFNYYYGAGMSSGWEESRYNDPETRQVVHTYGNPTTGIDLIAGIEMTVLNTVISLDYKPNVNLAGRNEFYRGQVGISARTVLVKSKEQNKRKRQRARAKRKKNNDTFGDKLKNTFNFKNH
ncbi:hypothetical protein [Arthrospiribacter ruber]|uniref:DUF3575 domain-containing protein n=1 Tax=Arthrospiribacter ruber TaxID=2487934 RepID=A0A951IXE7_9BACT|nr:hypothetical protein [Arthrospiribacter ruber]MBW3468052.1 hypothetical protein [Arthrospiribacter ruber]